jgi:hypothetical protein
MYSFGYKIKNEGVLNFGKKGKLNGYQSPQSPDPQPITRLGKNGSHSSACRSAYSAKK